MTPYYEHGGITIYHGDCRDVLPILLMHKFDLVVTSPPYNLGGEPWPHLGNWKPGDSAGGKSKWRNGSDAGNGIQYRKHVDSIPWDQYASWQRETLNFLWECISDDGAIFYNHKPRVIGARLWTPLELLPMSVQLRQIIIWARPGGMNFNPTAYVPTHEWIMVLAKSDWRLKSRGASGVGDVWLLNLDENSHPAPFPRLLPLRAIETTDAQFILDPFMGSGTTLRAAKDLGRRAIGIEIDEYYCEMAANRLRQEVLF
jgi:site-specific DNA-methyltransferase (adenine-specific)